MKPLLISLPLLLIAIGIAVFLWHTYVQQTEAKYYAGLERSVKVVSDAFEDNEDIPVGFTCAGEAISPPLSWSSPPANTKSWVLLVTDDDLPTARFRLFQIVHWVLYNIPGDVTELASNITDKDLSLLDIKAGTNWSRGTHYYPPCPVSGTGRHRYVFRLYALDVGALEPEASNRGGIMKAMEGHILAYGELSGFCEK